MERLNGRLGHRCGQVRGATISAIDGTGRAGDGRMKRGRSAAWATSSTVASARAGSAVDTLLEAGLPGEESIDTLRPHRRGEA